MIRFPIYLRQNGWDSEAGGRLISYRVLRDDERLGQCILYGIDSEGYMLTKTNTT